MYNIAFYPEVDNPGGESKSKTCRQYLASVIRKLRIIIGVLSLALFELFGQRVQNSFPYHSYVQMVFLTKAISFLDISSCVITVQAQNIWKKIAEYINFNSVQFHWWVVSCIQSVFFFVAVEALSDRHWLRQHSFLYRTGEHNILNTFCVAASRLLLSGLFNFVLR